MADDLKPLPGSAGEQLFTREAPVSETSNTQLAAALITMGIPFNECETGAIKFVGDGIQAPGGTVTWVFAPQSKCGKYKTAELMDKWHDKEWLTDPDNEHPQAYIACAMHNYRLLIKKIHEQTPMGVVRKGSRCALIDLGASPHLQDIIFQKL